METIEQAIIRIAKSYVGQTEISGNHGWIDKAFQKKMADIGWHDTYSWCALLNELIWKEAYGKDSLIYEKLDRLCSPSATATAANFKMSKDFETGAEPRPGAMILWQMGKSWHGHAGIVIDVLPNKEFKTVEGNTNEDGSSNGYAVFEKIRKTGLPFKPKGLNIVCFVYPPKAT